MDTLSSNTYRRCGTTHSSNSSPASVRSVAIAVALGLLQGCSHTASVSAPALPDQFRNAVDAQYVTSSQAWWETLDPELSVLISRALRDNLDLAVADARISAARARLGIARSVSSPDIGSVTRSTREKLSDNGLLQSSNGARLPDTYTLRTAGLDASWELDLFGAHKAERQKAAAHVEQAIAEREAMQLALAAEVARVYLEHITYAQQLDSAKSALDFARERLDLRQQQFDNGTASESDVALAKLEMERASERIPGLTTEVDARRYAMSVLLSVTGEVALPTTSPMLGDDDALARTQVAVDVGLPSDLLRRRPDVRKAEAQFEAAVADRSIAVADQYPRFSIFASIGNESLEQGTLLDSASRFWTLAPQVTMPFFDGGKRKAVVSEREAQLAAATAEYRKTVIAALSDVEQALIRHHGMTRAMQSNVAALEHARDLLDREHARYQHGGIAKPEWLASQQNFENHRQSALESKRQALVSLITLYKTLGGEPGTVSS